MSQEELLLLISKKEEKAFTYLYDKYSKSLFSVITTFIKNTEEAEEVLELVFIKIWQNIETYPKSNLRFYTWLIGFAREAAADKIWSTTFINTQEKDSNPTFLNNFEYNSKQEPIANGIGLKEFEKKLKPKCIQIINLLFFKGYTQKQTAEKLGIAIENVKTHNRNCINDVRNYLTKE